MPRKLRKVAIVTGSATGIGAAIAKALARAGWNLMINYTKSAAEARSTAMACERLGADVLVMQGNVAEDGDCRALAQAALKRWRRIDALVNNAGTTRFVKAEDLEGMGSKDFQRIFAVNVLGAFQMTRAAVPALKRSRGAIVNISSHSGFSGMGSSTAYAASKGALNTLTLGLARALAPQVRVNALCPGFVDTRWSRRRMTAAAYRGFKRGIAKASPLGRMVAPEDVAEAALWFIIGGRTITGQLLVIDGGTHLGKGINIGKPPLRKRR
jgi:3-oxoacyl-[acyl-carrier protein] reductase